MSPGGPRPDTSWVRMIFISGLLSATGGGVRQQGHLAGVLDGARDLTLLLRADAGHPPSTDLAAVGDELAQQRGVLVIDVGDPLLVERVHLLLRLAKCRSLSHVRLRDLLERWLFVEVARTAGGSATGRSGTGPRVVEVSSAARVATAAVAGALTAAGAVAPA